MKTLICAAAIFVAIGLVGVALCKSVRAASLGPAPAAEAAVQTEVEYHIQAIDAQYFTPTMSGGLQASVSEPIRQYDTMTMSRSGALADGASVLVIRWATTAVAGGAESVPASAPYPVTFTIGDTNNDGSSTIGSLSLAMPKLPAPVGGAAGPNVSVTVPAGSPDVVFYCPPDQYRFPPAAATDAAVHLQNARITLTVSAGGGVLGTGYLDVVRPQIVLVHGFLSSAATWSGLVNELTVRAKLVPTSQLFAVDYSTQNDSGYDVNCAVVRNQIHATIFQQDRFPDDPLIPQIAATRLDVIGHSMGGTLTAWYAADLAGSNFNRGDGFPPGNGVPEPFRRSTNFGVGDIRRFISIGSPFQGSPVAGFIVKSFSYKTISATAANLGSGDADAFWDLGTASAATNDLDSTTAPVAWLPIAGIAGNGGGGLGAPWAAVDNAFNFSGANLGLTTTNSDLIVLEASAEDGDAAGLKTDVVQNVVHTAETSDGAVYTEIEEALDLGTNKGGSKLFNATFTN